MGGRGARVIPFFEIGDLEGPGRPGNMIDTHSLNWPRAGFGPAFRAISTVFLGGRYSETPPLEIHLPRSSYWVCVK